MLLYAAILMGRITGFSPVAHKFVRIPFSRGGVG